MTQTSLQNGFQTQLSAEYGPNDLTAFVDTVGTLTSPCYVVINYDQQALTEVILFDGTFGASSFVTTSISNRYLPGSAQGSNITHPIGSKVICAPLAQHIEDVWAAVSALTHASLSGLGNDDHTQYSLADGSRAFTGTVAGVDPSSGPDLATKSYVDAQIAGGIATGTLAMFATDTPPSGWLICDGAAVSRAGYNDLFLVIGTDYGSGDGSTTFNLPDFRNVSPIGAGTQVSRAATAGALTDTVPAHDHIVPSHNHTMPSHSHTVDPPATTSSSAGSHNHGGSTGGETAGDGSGPSAGIAGSGHYHTLSSDGAHTHSTNIGSFSSGSTDPGDTNSSGSLTTDTESAVTVDVLHPVLGINFIIKT